MFSKLKLILPAIFLILFISCARDKVSKDIDNNLAKSLSASGINSRYPENLATNIDTGDFVTVNFLKSINSSSINDSSITVVEKSTQKSINGKILLSNNKIEFIPLVYFSKTDNSTIASGLKPNSTYTITLSKSIKDTQNNYIMTNDLSWEFTTSTNNYGIYWFGPNGVAQKYMPNKTNLFYSDSKPTIIYSHGWQSGSSKNNYWMEQPYIIKDKYSSFDTSTSWINKGYNIGAFVWTQLADEDEVQDAEAKIWVAQNSLKNMRYRMKDGTYKDLGGTASVGDLFYSVYSSALSKNANSITLAGHSLGNQVVTKLTENIMTNYETGKIGKNLIPKRIALLDPFWSKNGKSYLNNKWTGEKSREVIKKAISTYGTTVEQYKSTALGGLVAGDENLDMRKMTAFYRIWPDFIPVTESGIQHSYAYVWYFDSMGYTISTSNGVSGASSDINALKNIMNYGKSSYYYYYNNGNGNKTASSGDDTFLRGSGVSTW